MNSFDFIQVEDYAIFDNYIDDNLIAEIMEEEAIE